MLVVRIYIPDILRILIYSIKVLHTMDHLNELNVPNARIEWNYSTIKLIYSTLY